MIHRARALALTALACGGSAPPLNNAAAPAEEPPVALNAEPAVQYPPGLYDQRIEGNVVLRLYADSTGQLAPESTRVAESSGNATLDSAAVRGVSRLRYAPARRRGLPVATVFLQTIEFRRPGGGGGPPPPTAQPVGRQARADSARVRRDTGSVVPRDSTRVRRESGGAPAAGSTTRPDSARTQPDTGAARPDTSGAAH